MGMLSLGEMLHLMRHEVQLHGLRLFFEFCLFHLEALGYLKSPGKSEACPPTRGELILDQSVSLALLARAIGYRHILQDLDPRFIGFVIINL